MDTLAVGTRQAGELLGISEKTIRRLIHSKRIHAVRAGRRVTVPIRSLQQFLQVDECSSLTQRQAEKNDAGES